ncbi:MAG: hypothetical protein KGI67_10235 [Pseudomonadota bacterium]|nr:hypothetical protein [Pseudomonadota bacterium]
MLVRTQGLLRTEVAAAEVFTVAGDDKAAEGSRAWEAPLATLRTALPRFARRGEALTVVLSNHYSHYILLPALPSLSSSEEDDAYARHTFREVYGEAASAWTVRVSGDSPKVARVASAIEDSLLDALQRAARDAGVRLESVQPFLMTAYNAFHSELARRTAWFALYEPGRVCISLCSRGGLHSVRGCPAGDAWRTELPLLLDREARLQELEGEAVPTQAFVFHPSQALPSTARPLGDGLAPLTLAEIALPVTSHAQDLAMALVGI